MKRAIRQAWVYGSLEDDDNARRNAKRRRSRARKRRSTGTVLAWLFVGFIVLVAISNAH